MSFKNESEIDVDLLVEKIFNEEPKESCSIQLSLEENISLSELSDLLTYITVMGIKKLFSVNGSKIKLENMNKDHIDLVNKYVNSFGFNMNLTILNKDEFEIKFKNENEKKNLSDYIYTIKNNDKKYNISFEHIVKKT